MPANMVYDVVTISVVKEYVVITVSGKSTPGTRSSTVFEIVMREVKVFVGFLVIVFVKLVVYPVVETVFGVLGGSNVIVPEAFTRVTVVVPVAVATVVVDSDCT